MEPCCRYLDLGYHTGSRHDGGGTKWGGPLPCGGGFERASLDKLDSSAGIIPERVARVYSVRHMPLMWWQSSMRRCEP